MVAAAAPNWVSGAFRSTALVAIGLTLAPACKRFARDHSEATAAASASTWQKVDGPKGSALAPLVKTALAKTPAGLTPVVYIGATWCPPCRAIKSSRTDPRMVDAFEGTFVVELDLDSWPKAELDSLGYVASSIPVFIAVDMNGHAKGPKIDGGAWGDNIPENMAPPLKTFMRNLRTAK